MADTKIVLVQMLFVDHKSPHKYTIYKTLFFSLWYSYCMGITEIKQWYEP
jgi:hypothetical protein